jgi:hypothetical protein
MEKILKLISMSLPIIFVVKNGGNSNIRELSESLYGRGIEFRTLKTTDKFIRKEISCLDYDGFNLTYNRFSDKFVKDDKLDSYVEGFLDYCLKGYANWKLYLVNKN